MMKTTISVGLISTHMKYTNSFDRIHILFDEIFIKVYLNSGKLAMKSLTKWL